MKQFINIVTVLVALLSIPSINAHAQTTVQWQIPEKVDAAIVTGLEVGSSGMTRTVGCEATMLVNNKMRIFASGTFIFPGRRELRIGVISNF